MQSWRPLSPAAKKSALSGRTVQDLGLGRYGYTGCSGRCRDRGEEERSKKTQIGARKRSSRSS